MSETAVRAIPGYVMRALMPATLLLLLAACAPIQPPLEDRPASGTPAVLALTDNAATLLADGEYDGASASLERALRLEPRNPLLWYRLARVRLAQEAWREAESLALRSLGLEDDPQLYRANWELIAEARRGAHDREGVREAEARLRER